MSSRRLRISVVLIPLLLGLFAAHADVLRAVEPGAKIPDLSLSTTGDESGPISSFLGAKGGIVIFWATWSPRSLEFLAYAKDAFPRFADNGLKIVAINVDHEEMTGERQAEVKTKSAELALPFPVLLDKGLAIYGGIGVITVPTTLIVKPDLTIAEVHAGFPTAYRKDLPEAVETFLGIAKPKVDESVRIATAPRIAKNYAQQYFNLGKKMFLVARSPSGTLKHVPEEAVARLDESIKRDPDYVRPLILKAVVYHLVGDPAKRDAVVASLKAKEVPEPAERKFLGLGYLYVGADDLAAAIFAGLPPGADDPVVRFGKALSLLRTKDAGAKAAFDAMKNGPKAEGFDPLSVFADDGTLKPGSEDALRAILEKLLDIEKKAQGGQVKTG